MQALNESSLIEEVLKYIVACYGAEIYQDKQRLSNLIADLYTGEERLKRLYRRMVMEDAVSQQLYAISLKPLQEREGFYNRLVFQFKEANFYEEAFARQVLDVFLHGMNLLLVEPISTEATEEDGEWVDEYGVKYSADRKKLIRAPESLCKNYRVLDGTVVICDNAFCWCKNLQEITLPSGVMSIGDQAFGFCENLQAINVTESNEFYRDVDGVLYTKDLNSQIDTEKASQILMNAGWERTANTWQKRDESGTRTLNFRLVVNSEDAVRTRVAEIIRDQFASFGVQVNIDYLPYNDYAEAINTGNYEAAITGIRVGFSPSLNTFFGSGNIANYNNEEVLEIINAVSNTTEDNVLYEKYNRLYDIYVEEAPYIGLYRNTETIIYNQSLVNNITANCFNIYHNIEKWYRQ